MTSGGKWPTKWVPTRPKTTAEQGPVPRSSVNYRDDGPNQPPPEASLAVRDAAPAPVRPSAPMPAPAVPPHPSRMAPDPSRMVAPDPSRMAPDAAPAMTSVMPPPMAPPPSPGTWQTGQQYPVTRQRSHMRAVIGDELRVPALLCEFDGCAARYTHPDALGERELRDRAIAMGWQYDLIGRLACPSCVRHAPTFWTRRPQAPASWGERDATAGSRWDHLGG